MNIRGLVFVLILTMAAACDRGSGMANSYQSLNILGVNYSFPSAHVANISTPEQAEAFVRLIPPDSPYMMIYSRKSYRDNQQGPNVPTIAFVNDVPGEFDIVETSSGLVICEPGLRLYNCGLRVEDQGVKWSILFNQNEVDRALSIRNSAIEMLSEYRRNYADGR